MAEVRMTKAVARRGAADSWRWVYAISRRNSTGIVIRPHPAGGVGNLDFRDGVLPTIEEQD